MSRGRRRPWRAAAPLARGQGLGLALGDTEHMRSEARRPGTRRIVAGRRRMAGAGAGGGSAQLGLARARGERRGTGHRELEEDKAHGLGSGRIRSRTTGMGSTGRRRDDGERRLAAWHAEGRRGRVSLARGARGKRVGRKLGAREWFGSWCGAWPARGRGAVPDARRRTDAVTAKNRGGREMEMVVMVVL